MWWWCIVLGHTHLGKGPLKAYYEGEIAKKDWTKVTVRTLWLQAEDYPLLLGMGGCEGGGRSGREGGMGGVVVRVGGGEWEGGWEGVVVRVGGRVGGRVVWGEWL